MTLEVVFSPEFGHSSPDEYALDADGGWWVKSPLAFVDERGAWRPAGHWRRTRGDTRHRPCVGLQSLEGDPWIVGF